MGSIAQERYKSYEIKNGEFLANETPVQIFSGEMHYARIPKGYRFPFDKAPEVSKMTSGKNQGTPTLYYGGFEITQSRDVFLYMTSWGKGIVFVNGHHLGKYWNVVPQQTLYLPGCWLKKGKNEITIFEQQNDTVHEVLKTSSEPVLEALKQKN